MKLDYDLQVSLELAVQEYRKSFLKRKNVNRYKKTNKHTPEKLDKLINSFDRKIKGISIFTEDVKKQYFAGLNDIFRKYHESREQNKLSKKDAYFKYLAENYITLDRHLQMTFDEFVKSGLCSKYRKLKERSSLTKF